MTKRPYTQADEDRLKREAEETMRLFASRPLVTVPLHSLRNVLRFMRPAAEADALTATELAAFRRLADLAGMEWCSDD
jgi:hypothetical protein